ncbi:hypothetical protein FQN51_009137 [Onygenales sp. PD_10]|nr:hypothetical protein FQN51_009137 [Onygenales sp. PD_10]
MSPTFEGPVQRIIHLPTTYYLYGHRSDDNETSPLSIMMMLWLLTGRIILHSDSNLNIATPLTAKSVGIEATTGF